MVGMNYYLVQTTSGELDRALDGTKISWKESLNSATSGSITLKKKDIRDISPRRLRSWWGSILVTVTNPDGVEVPKFAGPIGTPLKEDRDSITLEWDGIREVLKHRIISKDMTIKDMSGGDAAWLVVQEAMNRPNGLLPIVHTMESEPGSYHIKIDHWNLANNDVDRILSIMTNVPNGPDIMFRPRWKPGSDHSAIEWDLVHGTVRDPAIPQTYTPIWDTTVPQSDIVDVDITSNASALTNRVWATGSGQGKDTARSDPQENLNRAAVGYPFLETHISAQDTKVVSVLNRQAAGRLRASQAPVDQVTLKVKAEDGQNPFSEWNVGDLARVNLSNEWFLVPGGERNMRIIEASSQSPGEITVEMQEEQWGE